MQVAAAYRRRPSWQRPAAILPTPETSRFPFPFIVLRSSSFAPSRHELISEIAASIEAVKMSATRARSVDNAKYP